ncbi:MAG: hypothetical protein U0Q11_15190 [Vicinamibacterales bacterium]
MRSTTAFFELLARLLQFSVALLDRRQHVIETIDELPDLVLVLRDRANRVVELFGHRAGNRGEAENRAGDGPLQEPGEHIRHEEGERNDWRKNRGIAAQALFDDAKAALNAERADDIFIEDDRTRHDERAIALLDARRHHAGVGHQRAAVGREYGAIWQLDASAFNRRIALECRQCFGGCGRVSELDGRRARRGDDVADALEAGSQLSTRAEQLVEDDAAADHGKRCCTRGHRGQ